ncbi:MAG: 3'-5' exonuclease, partial [Candidatus Electryoneaceae bacterium]|nr:3'-5' exonuclease [Candidatus Electryoneaceae bacterium]
LTAIDNPADRLAVIGALRSLFFGISDEDLVRWVCHSELDPESRDSKSNRLDSSFHGDEISPSLADALTILRELHSKRMTTSADRIILQLLDMTDVSAAIRSQSASNHPTEIVSIRSIVGLARRYVEAGDPSLRGFRRWLENRMRGSDEKQGSPAQKVQQVIVNTIHGAKGLEFPIVFLANMNGESKKSKNVIPDQLGGRLAVRCGRQGSYFQSVDFDDVLKDEQQIQKAESLRLLYVAMTRARDHLVIPIFYGKKPKGYVKLLSQFVNSDAGRDLVGNLDDDENVPNYPANKQEGGKGVVINFNPDEIWERRDSWMQDRSQRLESALKRLPQMVRPSYHSTEVVTQDFLRPKAGSTGRIGRAVHQYMALCRLETALDSSLAAHIAREYDLSVENIVPLIKSCLRSDVWHRALDAVRFWREVPVIQSVTGGMIRGIVDLIWEDIDGNLHIADWKTGSFDPQRHTSQVRNYAEVVGRTICSGSSEGRKVISGILYFAKSERMVDVSLSGP